MVASGALLEVLDLSLWARNMVGGGVLRVGFEGWRWSREGDGYSGKEVCIVQ